MPKQIQEWASRLRKDSSSSEKRFITVFTNRKSEIVNFLIVFGMVFDK